MEAQFRASCADTSELILNLAPSYACNCRCPYCYEMDKPAPADIMSEEVVQAIYSFIDDRYDEQHFTTMRVQWYGGEPTLCLDLIHRMAMHFQDWCRERNVRYMSFMLSNAVRIGPEEAKIIAECGVDRVLITIDGPREEHNKRRPSVETDNPFESIMGAIAALLAEDIEPHCVMNVDRVNSKLLPQLQEEMRELFGIEMEAGRLCNYRGDYGTGTFKPPAFDLFEHNEYVDFQLEQFKQRGAKAEELALMLTPVDHFCSGQKFNYFVIDAFGDVYKCDGWMGDKSRMVFNLLTDEPVLDAILFDPFEDPKCSTCEFLSICWGNCVWERELTGWPCHPLKTSLDRYEAAVKEAWDARKDEATQAAN